MADTKPPDDELKKLIALGRATKADWFKETTTTGKIATLLGAMANTLGGTVIMGVGPTGKVEGVSNPDKAIDRILQAALQLQPALIIPIPRPVKLDEKTVIVVRIPAGMPNVYGLDGRYMRREGAQNVGLKPMELRRLIIERGVTSFESEAAPNATMDSLDWDKARAYAQSLSSVSTRQDIEKLLERRGCLVKYQDTLRPTHAGILLFGKDPQYHMRGSEITAARFPGMTMSDVFNREDITGTLPEQIRRAETFLKDHLRKGVKLGDKMARQEQLEYPMEAARELVVNAVAHRDYSINGDGIRLFIFRDHMEVSSPGGLAGPVTVANIKDERFSRNPVIVQVLADMGFIERLGYGVDRVIDLMKQQNQREPDFQETAGGFRVVLHRANQEEDTKKAKAKPKNLLEMDIEFNPRQEIAIRFLQDDPVGHITNSKLQELCPDVHPETIRRDLADLVSKEILMKKGQKRGSYYVLNKPKDSPKS